MQSWNTCFHKWKKIWIYKKSLNRLPFPKREQQRKKEDEEGEKVEKARKKRVDGKVLHLIALQGEMELEFTKNVKKQDKISTY